MNKSNFCETRNKTCHCFQYVFHSTLGFVGAEIFINFCFFIHNFGYRYARLPIKGSKDADFGLV